jgi:GH24 family phage-related lysozyme (muramidase)
VSAAVSTVTQAFLDKAFALIGPSEGRCSSLYKDTTNNITVGYGCKLSNLAAAHALPFEPADSITHDFLAVSGCPAGKPATWYKPYTKAVLSEQCMRSLFDAQCTSFIASLRGHMPGYDAMPEPVRLGLLDMTYNMGAGWLFDPAKFPMLKVALKQPDYLAASLQCSRHDIPAERNAAIAALFVAASRL